MNQRVVFLVLLGFIALAGATFYVSVNRKSFPVDAVVPTENVTQAHIPAQADSGAEFDLSGFERGPYDGPGWSFDTNVISDTQASVAIHLVEFSESHYTSIVYSVAPGPAGSYTGTLTLPPGTFLRDSEGNTYPSQVDQVWSTAHGVTVGSMSFSPVSSTMASASLVIPSLEKSDESEIEGLWILDLLVNQAAPHDPSSSFAYSSSIPAMESMTHALVDGSVRVGYNGEGVSYHDYYGATPDAEPTYVEITPAPDTTTSTLFSTPSAPPTFQWAPNSDFQFSLIVEPLRGTTTRFISAALEPTTGVYRYDVVDVP